MAQDRCHSTASPLLTGNGKKTKQFFLLQLQTLVAMLRDVCRHGGNAWGGVKGTRTWHARGRMQDGVTYSQIMCEFEAFGCRCVPGTCAR